MHVIFFGMISSFTLPSRVYISSMVLKIKKFSHVSTILSSVRKTFYLDQLLRTIS